MKRNKRWMVGVVGAVTTGLLCLLPPVITVLFGSAVLAFVPAWLDFVLIPVFLFFSVGAFYLWYRDRKLSQN